MLLECELRLSLFSHGVSGPRELLPECQSALFFHETDFVIDVIRECNHGYCMSLVPFSVRCQ